VEELAKVLTLEEVQHESLQCKIEVWKEIQEIKARLQVGDTRMGDIEAILARNENLRVVSTNEIKSAIHDIHDRLASHVDSFSIHDKEEIARYDKIIQQLDTLTSGLVATKAETDENSNLLKTQRVQAQIEHEVAQRLEEEHKPYKEIKMKVIYTVATIVTTAVIAGMWELIMFVAQMDTLLNGGQ